MQSLSRTFRRRRAGASAKTCQFAVYCGENHYAPLAGPYDETNPSLASSLIPWSDAASGKRLAAQMSDLFDKFSMDEFALAVMLFFDSIDVTGGAWSSGGCVHLDLVSYNTKACQRSKQGSSCHV